VIVQLAWAWCTPLASTPANGFRPSSLNWHSLTVVLHISLVSPQWMEHGSRRVRGVTARLPSRDWAIPGGPTKVRGPFQCCSAAGSGLSGGAKPAPPHRDADKYDLQLFSGSTRYSTCRTRTPSKITCNNFRLIQYLKLYPKAGTKAVSLRQHSA
jgi:hypothetical protein